jgi:hypothetical protein
MERRCQVGRAAAALVGAASALAVEEVTRDRLGSARVELAALGLITAAAIYPACRRERRSSGPALREAAAVVAATGLALAGRGRVPGPGSNLGRRGLIALGWAAHAAFDDKHRATPGSRLPAWYADLCAGYDVAFAAALLRAPRMSHASR